MTMTRPNATLDDHIRTCTRESNVLVQCVPLLSTFGDILYFSAFIAQFVERQIASLGSWKHIDTRNVQLLANAYCHVHDSLNTCIAERIQVGGYQGGVSLGSDLVAHFSVSGRKQLEQIIAGAKDVEARHRDRLAVLAANAIQMIALGRILSLRSIEAEATRDVLQLFASSCGFGNPGLYWALPKSTQDVLLSFTGPRFKPDYQINDPETKSGAKQQVVVDIMNAVCNGFIDYAVAVMHALENKDVQKLDGAKKILSDMVFFFADTTDMNLPRKDILELSREVNFHTLLQAAKSGNAVGNGHFLIIELPNDLMARKFYVKLPGDYGFFSNVAGLVRYNEYQQKPGQFAAAHETERSSSIRVQSSKRLLCQLDALKSDLWVEDKAHDLLRKTGEAVHNPTLATAYAGLAWSLLYSLDLQDATPNAAIIGVLKYFELLFLGKSRDQIR